MSKYTTEVRFICENYAGLSESKGQANVNEIIQKACPKVFDFGFPIYDEGYRNVLESKILKHYYTREICAETVGLWKLWLDTKLNEIMPYYNQLYKSTTLDFNPFYDFDYTTNSNRDIGHDETTTSRNTRTDNLSEHESNSSTVNQSGTSKNVDKYSDTPQGGLQNVESGNYLTNATIDEGNTSSTGTGNSSRDRSNTGTQGNDGTGTRKFQSTDEYLEHVAGKKGGQSYSSLLQEYRKTFMNIDMMIIDDLSDLFFNLW